MAVVPCHGTQREGERGGNRGRKEMGEDRRVGERKIEEDQKLEEHEKREGGMKRGNRKEMEKDM